MLPNGIKTYILVLCLVNFIFEVNFSYASDQGTSSKCSEALLPTPSGATLELDSLKISEEQRKSCEKQEKQEEQKLEGQSKSEEIEKKSDSDVESKKTSSNSPNTSKVARISDLPSALSSNGALIKATAIVAGGLGVAIIGSLGDNSRSSGGVSRSASGSCSNSGASAASFETSEYLASYAPKEINASAAYALGCTGSGVTVSVVDAPSDSDHPDLDANYVTGWDASAGDTSSDCGGSCSSSHGVHVAGIIAAEKNGTGMHGIAYNAKIKPITIFSDSEADDTNTSQLITAIGHASGSDIAVMNNSWGASEVASYSFGGGTRYYIRPILFSGAQLSSGELNAWKTAASTTAVVWANGNDGQNTANGKMHSWTSNAGASGGSTSHADYIGYVDTSANTNQNVPSWRGSYQFYDNGLSGPWLTVVALNEADAITSYSNGCGVAKNYCIAAPGGELNFSRDAGLYSTVNPNDSGESGNYGNKQGTSMAAPVVSGALAILKQQFPNLTPTQLVSLVISTATDLGAAGVDEVYGVGKLNLGSAATPSGALIVVSGSGSPVGSGGSGSAGRIRLSSAFQTLSQKNFVLGVFDSYNRSYSFMPSISNEVPQSISLVEYIDDKKTDTIYNTFWNDSKFTGSFISDTKTKSLGGALLKGLEFFAKKKNSEMRASFLLATDTKAEKLAPVKKNNVISSLYSNQLNVVKLQLDNELDKNMRTNSEFVSASGDDGTSLFEVSSSVELIANNFSATLKIGMISEEDRVLASEFRGPFGLSENTTSTFFEGLFAKKINNSSQIAFKYLALLTSARLQNSSFGQLSRIYSNKMEASVSKKWFSSLDFTTYAKFELPIAVRKGALNYNTILGYNENGSYRSVNRSVNLGVANREKNIVAGIRSEIFNGFNAGADFVHSINQGNSRGKKDTSAHFLLTRSF